MTDNVAFSSVHRFLGERSRAESSRDDNFRRLCSSLVGANGRSPEGGLGWNLCLLREKGTIGAGQSLFSLAAFSGSSYLSAERFLERDAETSSDD